MIQARQRRIAFAGSLALLILALAGFTAACAPEPLFLVKNTGATPVTIETEAGTVTEIEPLEQRALHDVWAEGIVRLVVRDERGNELGCIWIDMDSLVEGEDVELQVAMMELCDGSGRRSR